MDKIGQMPNLLEGNKLLNFVTMVNKYKGVWIHGYNSYEFNAAIQNFGSVYRIDIPWIHG